MKKHSKPVRIILNNWNESIFVDPANKKLQKEFNKFVALWTASKWTLCEKMDACIRAIENNVVIEEWNDTCCRNVKIVQSAYENIERIFGPETLRMYFRKLYEENPDFVPDIECIDDFILNMQKALKIVYSKDRPRGYSIVEVN
jgi:hypothetical protein